MSYFDWNQEIFFDRVFLAGRFFQNMNESAAGPLAWSDVPSVVIMPMHGGNHVVAHPYRGEDQPSAVSAKTFTPSLLADDEEDYYWMLSCVARGAAIYYCPGIPAVDSFQAISGNAYQLTRPQAIGVVSSVTALTHPARFLLDGVLTPGAASVSGRTVTAMASGTLDVWYMPVCLVVAQTPQEVVAEPGDLRMSLTLFEVVP